MSLTAIGILIVIFSLFAAIAGIILWNRYVTAIKKMAIFERRAKSANLRSESLAISNSKLERSLGKQRGDNESLAKTLEELRGKFETNNARHSSEISAFGVQLRKSQEQTEHHQTQENELLRQIKQLDRDKAELSRRYDDLRSERERLKHEIDEQVQIRQTELQLNSISKRYEELSARHGEERKLRAEKEAELKLQRRKALHNGHFARILKGQRDLMSERCRNWERALGLLANAILRDRGVDVGELNLGQQVACALELSCKEQLLAPEIVAQEEKYYEHN